MIAIAKILRRIADHLDPAGSAHSIRESAARAFLALPVRHILALKRDIKAAEREAAKNLTGK